MAEDKPGAPRIYRYKWTKSRVTRLPYYELRHVIPLSAIRMEGSAERHWAVYFDQFDSAALERDGLHSGRVEIVQAKFSLARTEFPLVTGKAGRDDRARPPIYRPSLLLDMMVPFDRAQDMQANLSDVYPLWVSRHGHSRAEMIRICQVAWLIGGMWWEKLLSSGERLLNIFRIFKSG